MNIEFEFEIGQVVTTVASSIFIGDERVNGEPILLNIVERQMNECPGGFQVYYVVRGNFTSDNFNPCLRHYTKELTRFNEVELMSLDDYKLARGAEDQE